ncbi:MAG: prepilin-type N-terminal cleavage/methylation domain-containing protein [Actinomycetia bacterium]|nr:prepilin-type N-terminal cleavage/methylation domain-containing protein [Actinomycetes bacterium]
MTHNDERGFSLVELMVVVLVIAVLIGLALPTFLGARQRAEDRSSQANVRNAMTAAMVLFADDADFSGTNAATLGDIEPAIDFVDANVVVTADQVGFAVQIGDERVTMVALSGSGDCFYMQTDRGNTVNTSADQFAARPGSAGGDCRADNVADLTWGAEW